MYYGRKTLLFPTHPHRGFEIFTISQKGLIDHAHSMGVHRIFGNRDV